ncbi:MAG: RNA polymerase sigma factor SigZ [Nitrospira sp.]|nr:RNA polymerase sigma factor SigZ [Nitrospira sp.]MCP9462233.1 RNA polymerase sigma factor SigZ [Nitrospira sp.]MCP9474736.1 RNA polymerase sigma factor SigZ [Nitrospira sp.]
MTTKTEELWQLVHDGLRAFIAKRVSDHGHIDDILQDVFERVHRQMDSVKDSSRIVSWVYQITRNTIIDYYRKPGKQRETPVGLNAEIEALVEVFPSSDSMGQDEPGEVHAELADCLRPMIERLSKDYREAVVLVELDGLTQQAAARRLGISLPGMKSRVQRGRKQLRHMLNDCCLIELDRRGGVIEFRSRQDVCDPCLNRQRTGHRREL